MRAAVGILCGGQSRRMGTDKAGLLWQGSTLLERMVRELGAHGRELLISVASTQQAVLMEETVLAQQAVLVEQAVSVEQEVSAQRVASKEPGAVVSDQQSVPRVIPDHHPGCGPLGGIYSVLREAQADAVFFCAVDMPFVTEQAVEYLEQFLCSDFDGVIFTEGGRLHPLCGIYCRSLLPVLERQLERGERRVRSLMDTGRIKAVPLELGALSGRTLWNLNTPEDYRRAARPLVFCVSGVKNSGKTTMVEKLVQYFLPEFPKIGVIKHDGHDFSMDREGTDSFRAAQAGACRVAVFSGTHTALLETHSEEGAEVKPSQRYAPLRTLLDQMQDMDMVILEGMKDSPYPKVELVKKGNAAFGVCDPDTLIAVATEFKPSDVPAQPGGNLPPSFFSSRVPVMDWNDTERIAQAILQYFLPDQNRQV